MADGSNAVRRQPRPIDPAILRVIEALARRQARLDYEAQQRGSRS
jgi:hypothetical protein